MRKIRQTTFGKDHGNCFQACIASVLDLDLEDVPHFCNGDNPDWFDDLHDWCEQNGHPEPVLLMSPNGCAQGENVFRTTPISSPVIISGPSNRDAQHATIWRIGRDKIEMIWDPHPSGDGIEGFEDAIVFLARL